MPDIFEDVHCCVCENVDPTNFKVKYQKEKFSVIECNNCSFTFIPPYFRKQISYEQYKDENVANAVRNGNNWVKIERHKLRYDLIKKYKPKGSLFDLGAGWGHFMLTGQQLGYDVYGIEISEQPYLYSKNDLKLPVDHIDFIKMSVGIAECLKNGNGNLRLAGGSLSGIQSYLYEIVSKNAARLLKGRSFYIQTCIVGIVVNMK